MKLPPRERAPAKVYEMEADSGFLLLFKTRENAHLYTKDSIAPYKVNGSARRKRKQPAKSAKPSAAVAAKATKKGKATNASSASQANSSLLFPSSQPTPMTQQPITNFIELARQGSTTHRWEFADDNGGWSLYDLEASKLVEMEYQSWLQQPEVFVRSVHSGFFHYSVNFNKMEQTNIKHPARRVRKIRRVAATEGGQGASGGLFGSATVPSFLPSSPPQVVSSLPTFSMTPTPTNGPLGSTQPSPLTMCGSAMNSINSSTTNAPFSFGHLFPAGTALPPPPIPAGSATTASPLGGPMHFSPTRIAPPPTEAIALALQRLLAASPPQAMPSPPTFSTASIPSHGPLWSTQSPASMNNTTATAITPLSPIHFSPVGARPPPPSQSVPFIPSIPMATAEAIAFAQQSFIGVPSLLSPPPMVDLGAQQQETGITGGTFSFPPSNFTFPPSNFTAGTGAAPLGPIHFSPARTASPPPSGSQSVLSPSRTAANGNAGEV